MHIPDLMGQVVRASRRRSSAVIDLLVPLQGALMEAVSVDGTTLTVAVSGGVVTVRGEVGSLDQISRASRVIESFQGDTEIVNLVRVGVPTGAPRST